ncbi:MAG: pyridoxamine 5'-phosphate oxidase family protein [Solirubrobacteraceae bacterium]
MTSTFATINSWRADHGLGDHIGEEKQMTGSNTEQTISQEKYVSVASFRKTGVAVATPTWIVPLDGSRVGLLTSSASGKAKRLCNNPSVTLQPSDVRGRVKAATTAVTGTVELVTSGPDFETITTRVKAKYGLMVPISRLVDRLRHLGKGPFPYADTGVVITLHG